MKSGAPPSTSKNKYGGDFNTNSSVGKNMFSTYDTSHKTRSGA